MSAKRLHVMFDDDDILLDAIKEIVKNKIYIYEVYTPFPVHGLDKAMKLKPTNISIATFIYGCIGFTVAVLMMSCNVVSPQVMWIKKIRTNIIWSFIISIVVNIGMWFERFVIIVTSLHRDYLPSSWTMFSPTFVDIGIFLGTIGFFFVLFLLYARSFPVVAQAEIKTILKSSGEIYKKNRDK